MRETCPIKTYIRIQHGVEVAAGAGPWMRLFGYIAAKALTEVGISVTLVRSPAALRPLYCAIPQFDPSDYLESCEQPFAE